MTNGPQSASAAAALVFSNVARTFHAAVLVDVGGALGCRMGAKVSTMINRPPQHGQGNARVLGD